MTLMSKLQQWGKDTKKTREVLMKIRYPEWIVKSFKERDSTVMHTGAGYVVSWIWCGAPNQLAFYIRIETCLKEMESFWNCYFFILCLLNMTHPNLLIYTLVQLLWWNHLLDFLFFFGIYYLTVMSPWPNPDWASFEPRCSVDMRVVWPEMREKEVWGLLELETLLFSGRL